MYRESWLGGSGEERGAAPGKADDPVVTSAPRQTSQWHICASQNPCTHSRCAACCTNPNVEAFLDFFFLKLKEPLIHKYCACVLCKDL